MKKIQVVKALSVLVLSWIITQLVGVLVGGDLGVAVSATVSFIAGYVIFSRGQPLPSAATQYGQPTQSKVRSPRPELPRPMPSRAPPKYAFCMHCGASLETGSNFCVNCGNTIATAGAPPPVVTETRAAPLMQRCPNPQCGRPAPLGRKFCTACGTRIT